MATVSHSRAAESPAVRSGHLLRANDALADERQWLAHLNRYLSLFDLEPLELGAPSRWRGLRRRKIPRFLRIRARTPRRIETGPLVTVLMPAWNSADIIEFAVRSLLKQTWQPLELIIIDDASTDDTWRVIQRLAREDSRIRAVRNAVNVGPYVSKNRALRLARGEFVTGLDADEWAHPECIENRLAVMLRDRAVKAAHDMSLRIRKNGRISRFGQKDPMKDMRILRIAYSGCMYEREFLNRRLGFFDSLRFGADGELINRARLLLGERFLPVRRLGTLSLDDPRTLTRDPVHGISRKTGLSPVRIEYRDAYLAWHEMLSPDDAYLPFPHHPRRFPAPEAMVVPRDDVQTVLGDTAGS